MQYTVSKNNARTPGARLFFSLLDLSQHITRGPGSDPRKAYPDVYICGIILKSRTV